MSVSSIKKLSHYVDYYKNYKNFPELDWISNSFPDILLSWLDPSNTPANILDLWFKYKEIPLLFVCATHAPTSAPPPGVPNDRPLISFFVLHHPMNILPGNTIDTSLKSSDHFASLYGKSRENGPAELDLKYFSQLDDADFLVPSAEALLNAKDFESFVKLEFDGDGDHVFFRSTIPVPPFLAGFLMDIKSKGSWESVFNDVVSFVRDIETHIPNRPNVKAAGTAVLRFLWLMESQRSIITFDNNHFCAKSHFLKSTEKVILSKARTIDFGIFQSFLPPPSPKPRTKATSLSSPAASTTSTPSAPSSAAAPAPPSSQQERGPQEAIKLNPSATSSVRVVGGASSSSRKAPPSTTTPTFGSPIPSSQDSTSSTGVSGSSPASDRFIEAMLKFAASTSESVINVNSKLAELQEKSIQDKDSNPTKWDDHVTPSQSRMLLFLSTPEGFVEPIHVPSDELRIFMESKQSLALPLLCQALASRRRSTAIIDPAKTFKFHKLNLASYDRNQSLLLSLFFCYKSVGGNSSNSSSNDAFSMAFHANSMSDDMIKLAAKSRIDVAGNVYELGEQVQNFSRELDFLFGTESRIYKSFVSLHSFITGEGFQALNENFENQGGKKYGAKLVDYLDQRVNSFMLRALQVTSFSELEYSLLDWSEIQSKIMSNDFLLRSVCHEVDRIFLCELPSNKRSTPRPTAVDDGSVSSSDSTPRSGNNPKKKNKTNKRKGKDADDNSSKISNSKTKKISPIENPRAIPDSWKLSHGDWAKISKDINSCPKFKDKAICGLYWFRGSCKFGKDCARSSSHCDLPNEFVNGQLENWILETKKKHQIGSN